MGEFLGGSVRLLGSGPLILALGMSPRPGIPPLLPSFMWDSWGDAISRVSWLSRSPRSRPGLPRRSFSRSLRSRVLSLPRSRSLLLLRRRLRPLRSRLRDLERVLWRRRRSRSLDLERDLLRDLDLRRRPSRPLESRFDEEMAEESFLSSFFSAWLAEECIWFWLCESTPPCVCKGT